MCSFWLVEALTRAGERIPEKLDQARQTGPQGETLGNFPQAFTHLALIRPHSIWTAYWAVIKQIEEPTNQCGRDYCPAQCAGLTPRL
jgi:hypothetical protein